MSFLLRSGYLPQDSVAYPTLGAAVAKELAQEQAELPSYVSIVPYRFAGSQDPYGPGFLGPQFAPLIVADGQGAAAGNPNAAFADQQLKVQNLGRFGAVTGEQADARLDLLSPSRYISRCPYKGISNYYHLTVKGQRHENMVWYYPEPVPEATRIKGLVSFYNEFVDRVLIDGVEQPRPVTASSHGYY